MTSRGYQNFDNVLEAIFAFLLLLKTTKIEDHKKRFKEFREIQEILFKYRKENAAIENVQELAVNMRYFDDENVIVGNEYFPEFEGKKLECMIDAFNTRKFNLMVISDKYQAFDRTEKWFGTEYAEMGEFERFKILQFY